MTAHLRDRETSSSDWWLHAMTYGAEKVLLVEEEQARLKELMEDKGPRKWDALARASDHLESTRSKLSATEADVMFDLIGSVARVAYETDGNLRFVEGVLRGVDFKNLTLDLETEDGIASVTYGRTQTDESGALTHIEPLIQLETTVPYRF